MSNTSSIVESFRTAFMVASATVASGAATLLEKIPTDIGKIASSLGIVLTCVLIYVHVSRELRERRKYALEEQLLQRQIAKSNADIN